jgi:hypothetical protein
MHSGCPVFYKVSVERFCVDINAANRQHGLELMIGSPAIAFIMGPDEDVAKPLDTPSVSLVCQDCLLKTSALAHLSEKE